MPCSGWDRVPQVGPLLRTGAHRVAGARLAWGWVGRPDAGRRQAQEWGAKIKAADQAAQAAAAGK